LRRKSRFLSAFIFKEWPIQAAEDFAAELDRFRRILEEKEFPGYVLRQTLCFFQGNMDRAGRRHTAQRAAGEDATMSFCPSHNCTSQYFNSGNSRGCLGKKSKKWHIPKEPSLGRKQS